jgi:CheY-like chemotaxis protein
MRKKTVMFIDDDASAVFLFGKFMERAGYNPVSVHVSEFVAALQREKNIDLILVDELMNTSMIYNLLEHLSNTDAMTIQQVRDSITKAGQDFGQSFLNAVSIVYMLRRYFHYEKDICVLVSAPEFAPANLDSVLRKYGATHVLEKPIDIDDFVENTLPYLLMRADSA